MHRVGAGRASNPAVGEGGNVEALQAFEGLEAAAHARSAWRHASIGAAAEVGVLVVPPRDAPAQHTGDQKKKDNPWLGNIAHGCWRI